MTTMADPTALMKRMTNLMNHYEADCARSVRTQAEGAPVRLGYLLSSGRASTAG